MDGPKAKPSLGPGMFQWDQHYLTDLPGVDAQHHGLANIINDLGNLLLGGNINASDIHKLCQQLRYYTE